MSQTQTQTVCPLDDSHCEVLTRMIEQVPQVQEIVAEYAAMGVTIPGAAESLQRALDVARKIKAIHFPGR